MQSLNPYITFNGNCREAMTFYQEVLGGELTVQAISESPIAAQMPVELQSHTLHSTLTSRAVQIMASDMRPPGHTDGHTVSLMLHCSSEEEINTLYSALLAGGKVRDPLKEQFWGGVFGALTDKFGINWSMNYDKAGA